MDQKILVGDRLTDEMISVGRELVQRLEKKLTIVGAFWYLLPEPIKWRLVLSTPAVRIDGPIKSYQKVQRTAKQLIPTIDVADVALISDKEPFYMMLKSAIHTGQGLGSIRFTNNVINGQHISDAFLYRVS